MYIGQAVQLALANHYICIPGNPWYHYHKGQAHHSRKFCCAPCDLSYLLFKCLSLPNSSEQQSLPSLKSHTDGTRRLYPTLPNTSHNALYAEIQSQGCVWQYLFL